MTLPFCHVLMLGLAAALHHRQIFGTGTEQAVARWSLQPCGQLGQPLMHHWAEEVELTGMACDPLCFLGLLGCVQALLPPMVEVPALCHCVPPPEQRGVLPQLT